MTYDIKGAGIHGPYRYALWRQWEKGPALTWVMLNPSTADGLQDDATIRKCVGFSRLFGYSGIVVWNLFAYRATDPRVMVRAHELGEDIIGPKNDALFRSPACVVVVAWGAGGGFLGRDRAVLEMLRPHMLRSIYRLGPPTKGGHPRHPLYVPYSTQLEEHV